MATVIDSDQHLYEIAVVVARPHRSRRPRRRAADRGRRARLPVGVLAGRNAARTGRRAVPGRDDRARRVARGRVGAAVRRPSGTTTSCRATTGTRRARQARRAGRRRGGAVPQLRPAVGAHAARALCRAAGQHGRVEPLVRDGRRATGAGGVHPVAHLTLRDPTGSTRELADARARRRAPGDDRARRWSTAGRCRIPTTTASGRAFCHHGITPVFHVADQPRPFADAWYTDERRRPASCRSRRSSSGPPPRSPAPI